MKRAVAWCVDALPFDARSRRAIGETLADWTKEEVEALNRHGRVIAHLRGFLSICRVATWSLIRETTDFTWCHGLARRCWIVVALVTSFTLATTLPSLPTYGERAIPLGLMLVPTLLLMVARPAMFLILAWRPVSSSAPGVGAACFLAAVVLILEGWVVPFSQNLFGELLVSSLRDLPGVEPSLLKARVMPSLTDAPSIGIVLRMTGGALLMGAVVLLAGSVANRSPLKSRWWLALAPMAYAVSIKGFFFAIGVGILFVQRRSAEDLAQGLAVWILAAAVAAVAMVYRRSTNATDPQVPSGSPATPPLATPR